MKTLRLGILSGAAMLVAAAPLFAQNVISVKAGLIHHVAGDAYLDGEKITVTTTKFPEMKESQVLRTERGRAEILLSPGAVLRMAEASEAKLLSTSLVNPEMELSKGEFLLEVAELEKDAEILLRMQDSTVQVEKRGLYGLDVNAGEVYVYDGHAFVAQSSEDGKPVKVKSGRHLAFATDKIEKFNKKEAAEDPFYDWSSRRARAMAMASMGSARGLLNNRMNWSTSAWSFNPYYGMFAFIPMRGVVMSPFGWNYWSPRGLYDAFYAPRPVVREPAWAGSPSYGRVGATSGGASGTVAGSGQSTAGGGSSAPVSRGSGDGGGRSR